MSPDEALAAARARVAKLESALRTVGEDDETFPILMAALKKAQSQAQERPIPDRIAAKRSFLERSEKRVEGARQAVGKAKEELAKAEALLEKEEAMFKDGQQRLRQLLEEEKAMPSPFAPPPVPSAGVATEISRMQAIIDRLQDELTRLRGSGGAGAGICEDEPMMDLPHAKKTRLEGGGGQQFLGIDFRHRSCVRRWIISQEALLRDVRTSRCTARYGLRATRVGLGVHSSNQARPSPTACLRCLICLRRLFETPLYAVVVADRELTSTKVHPQDVIGMRGCAK